MKTEPEAGRWASSQTPLRHDVAHVIEEAVTLEAPLRRAVPTASQQHGAGIGGDRLKPRSTCPKIIKQPVDPERVRTMPAQFGAVDRRLVYQKHIRRMSTDEIALYVFLQCVSDTEGLSFYSDERICEELHFSLNGLWKTREALVGTGFLLYRRPIYQLLNLPAPLEFP
jgi:hypothetical protein